MIYTKEFSDLKVCPTTTGPYRPAQIPGAPPISLCARSAMHHHPKPVLARRKVDQPARKPGGYSGAASAKLLAAMGRDGRRWTARELAEAVMGDVGRARTVSAVLMQMRLRGEVASTGMSGTGRAVQCWAL